MPSNNPPSINWPAVKFHGSVGDNERAMLAVSILGDQHFTQNNAVADFIDGWIERLNVRDNPTISLPPEAEIIGFVREKLSHRKRHPADIPAIENIVITILLARFQAAALDQRVQITFRGTTKPDPWMSGLPEDERRRLMERRKQFSDSGMPLDPGPRRPATAPEGQGFAEYCRWWFLYRWEG